MPRFEIDPAMSRVSVEARSSLHPIHAEATGLHGFIELDGTASEPGGLAADRGRVELAVSALRSGNPLYDRELQRRVDVRRYPTISGELRELRPAAGGHYLVSGVVTFRGSSQPAEDEMVLRLADGEVHLEGAHVFDIRDFGMEPPKILMAKVHPEVEVRVELVARAGSDA